MVGQWISSLGHLVSNSAIPAAHTVGFAFSTEYNKLLLLGERVIEIFPETMKFQDSKLCPSGHWRIALNYSEEVSSNLEVTHLNPKTAYVTYGDVNDPTFIGSVLNEYPKLYHERFINLIHFKQAFMTGHAGLIFNNCTIYTGNHNPHYVSLFISYDITVITTPIMSHFLYYMI